MELLRSALDTEGPLSPLGGEIQLWLALGLQVRSPPEGPLPNMSTERPFVAVHFVFIHRMSIQGQYLV